MRSRYRAAALFVAGCCIPTAARADLVTGFEAPAYTPGNIVGQRGWTVNVVGTTLTPFQVSTSNPYPGGTQSLMVTSPQLASPPPYPATTPNEYNPYLISPNTNTVTTGVTTTSFDFYIPSLAPGVTRGATPSLYLVSDAATDVDPRYGLDDYVGGVGFAPDGSIQVEEDVPGQGYMSGLVDTGYTWTPNTYSSFSISVNSTTSELTYSYDNSVIEDTTADYENTVGNVIVFDNLGPTAGETINYDNLSVTVPEPASLGLFGLCGLMLVRRRAKGMTTASHRPF
jgi:hypothetical protein